MREAAAIEPRMTRNETETQELETRLQHVDTERAALRETAGKLETRDHRIPRR